MMERGLANLKKQLIKEAAKGYDHFNLWYAETFLLKKGNRDTHKEILAQFDLKKDAEKKHLNP